MAKPPVCKIMDYGKFRYSEQKKAHGAKIKQKQVSVKEIKFRPSTDQGDYEIKLKNLIKFLNAGDKVKITIKFRGREMIHQQFGTRLLERVKTDLEDYGKIEQFPKLEGRQLVMVLSPIKKSSWDMTKKIKMKTNSGASKRFKIKSNGSIKRSSAFMRHILTKKSTKRKRQLRGGGYIAKCDLPAIKLLLPNSWGF